MTERTPTADASPIARPPLGPAAAGHCIPAAKLEPLRLGRRRVVTRARLLESLSAAVDSRRLTLVAAPPGSGKTTLLSSWIEAGAAPVRTAWLTVDEEDNAPERFWQGVLVALDPASAGSLRPLASARLPGELTALLDRAIGDGDEAVVLVLDDFQEVSDERVLAGITQLLKVAPPCFRLVIASRRDPALPLHRLRLAAQLAELRAAPLAFTLSNSTSKFSKEPAGIPGRGLASYASSGGTNSCHLAPGFMSTNASCHPLMTPFTLKVAGWPRA